MAYECSETGGNLKASIEGQSLCYFLEQATELHHVVFITAALFIYFHRQIQHI